MRKGNRETPTCKSREKNVGLLWIKRHPHLHRNGVDGRHGGDYTLFAAHWSALSVVAACLAAALRLA